MTDPHDIRPDLPPDLDEAEAAPLLAVGERLRAERPVPSAAFRGALARRLVELEGPGARAARPRHLRLLVATYLTAGAALLAIAALGVAGSGPLAAPDRADARGAPALAAR